MNLRTIASLAYGIVLGLVLTACGRSPEQKVQEAAKAAEEAASRGDIKTAAEKMSEMAGAAKAAEPVDFRELKALLPESLPGMKRDEATGQKSGAMGFSVSVAEARYSAESGANIQMKISDMGAVAGVGAWAAIGWAMTEIDRETATGYEKTTMYGSHKAHERYDRESKNGELQVLVAGRFLVEVDGSEVAIDDMKNALGKVDLAKLEGMRNVGVK